MRLPYRYVELEQEEMMYLDGGIAAYVNWWGVSLRVTKSECNLISGALFAAVTGAGSWASFYAKVAGLSLTPQALALFAVVSTVAATLYLGAQLNGLWVNRNWVGGTWVSF